MKAKFFLALGLVLVSASLYAQNKFNTQTGKAVIFSHTIAEDITATNNTVTGVINSSTGAFAVVVPVQGFEFSKALMQEHFNNSNFMDSKQYPRILLKGKIMNLGTVNFSKDGTYELELSGELTIKGTTKPVTEKALLELNNGKMKITSRLLVKDIGSYGVGKPKGSKKANVADDIEVNFTAVYEKES